MSKFKGVILAGGRGTRLSPLTDVTNKFLMPVYDKLMIEYSVWHLVSAGITDIAIVLGVKSAGETIDYLKSGEKYGCKFTYFYQDEPKGVAHALYQAKDFARDNNIVVLCADNIIYDDLNKFVDEYDSGAFITVKEFTNIRDLQKFAVLNFWGGGHKDPLNGTVHSLEEKPEVPGSSLAFCGVQIYDRNVWNIIEGLEPSSRGEYEIVDVINYYIDNLGFSFDFLSSPWFDCGDKDSLAEAQQYAYRKAKNIDKDIAIW
jgi:glucose-1-phosphate thymidylyltransferase